MTVTGSTTPSSGHGTRSGNYGTAQGIVDSGVVDVHPYYDFRLFNVVGWDPTGALAAQGNTLKKVQLFATIQNAQNIVFCENQTNAPFEFWIGTNPHIPGSLDQLVGLRFYQTADFSAQIGTGAWVNLGSQDVVLAAFDGTIDYAGTSGFIHTYAASSVGFMPAFIAVDAPTLAFFDKPDILAYFLESFMYCQPTSLTDPCPAPDMNTFGNTQTLGPGCAFFFRYYYSKP